MLKKENIEVRVINHNISHYRNFIPNIKYGDKIFVLSHQLSKGSHYKVNCICDNCSNVKKMNFEYYYSITNALKENYYCNVCVKKIKTNKTNLEKYGCENISSSQMIKNKRKETNLKKWGVENVFQNEEIKKRNINTFNKKYGLYYTKTEDYRKKSEETRRNKNSKIFENERVDYKKYKKLVNSYTRISYKKLLENWDGFDYYDKEYIKNNFKLHFNNIHYPTIDHKISIFNGFKSSIPPEIIGNIENLCFTKRNNNSSKHDHLNKPKRLL